MAFGMALGDYVATLRGLSRDVRLYLVVPLLLGLTIWGGITSVLTNLYLVRLGYGPEFVGLINSAGAFGLAIFALPAAALGRRFGCRRSMIVGLAVCSGGNVGLALAGLLPGEIRGFAMPAANALGSFGLDLYLVNSGPLLMGLTSPVDRGHAYSLQAAFSPIAAFVGSLVGGLLPTWLGLALGAGIDTVGTYRLALVISGLILASSAVVVLEIREPDREVEPPSLVPGAAVAAAPWGLIGLMCLVTVLQCASEGISRTFTNVYLSVGLGLSTPEVGALLSLAQLVAFPAALVTPLLLTRWSDGGVFVRASLGMALGMLTLALVVTPAGASLGYIGVTALGCIARPCLAMRQFEIIPTKWWTTMSGATTLSFGLSNTVTTVLAGFLIVNSGFASAFILGGALTVAGGLLFWATTRAARPIPAK